VDKFDYANIHRDCQKYLAKWWTKFLNDSEPLKLTSSTKKLKTISTVMQYMQIQVPRNLAIYHELFGKDKLLELVSEGIDRMNNDDQLILDQKPEFERFNLL